MKKYLYIFAVLFFFAICNATTLVSETVQLTDFQKETIASVREITLQLILISVGVFAFLGSFATAEDRKFSCRFLVWSAFIAFVSSVAFGLLAYGNLIWTLGKQQYEPFGTVRFLAEGQWSSFMAGGLLLALFVLFNIRGRK